MVVEKTELEANDLLDFTWDDASDNVISPDSNVGKITEDPVDSEDEDEEEDEEPANEPVVVKKGGKKKAEEDTFDSFEDDEPTGDISEGSIYNDLYKDLKDSEIFKYVELEEGEDLDADKFFELQQKEIDTQVSERIKTWATEELDEEAQAFIKFKREGGKTKDFLSFIEKSSTIPVGEIGDSKYEDDVIRYQLTQEGWDRDEIEDRLEFLTDKGTKSKVAEKYDVKIKEAVRKEEERVFKQAEEDKKLAKKNEEDFKSSIKETLDSSDNVGGFKISVQDKTKLLNLLTKKEHKVNSTNITGFQKALSEAFQKPEKLILLAKLLDSDFDMTGFEKQVRTKHTREIKQRHISSNKIYKKSSSGSSLLESLEDFI
jgi:hypothetical protein